MKRPTAAAALLCLAACASTGTTAPGAEPPAATPTSPFRDPLAGGGQGPEMVVVPAGSFEMGAARGEGESWLPGVDQPRHRVRIENAFAIGRFEVTRAEFAAFVAASGWTPPYGCHDTAKLLDDENYQPGTWENPEIAQTDAEPVVCVSHADAEAYVAWLSRETAARYRLPSEAEWEYAARGGTTTPFPNGSDPLAVCAIGNILDHSLTEEEPWVTDCTDGFAHTAPVGSFPANAFGLHDVIGNAAEIVADCFFDDHRGAPSDGRTRTMSDCQEYVVRGGGWATDGLYARTAHRFLIVWDDPDNRIGFRVLRELD